MQHGLYLPTEGDFARVELLASLAREAENAGWDGFFIWDELLPVHEHSDVMRRALHGERGLALPTPLQTPRIPIWIGADSRHRAPRRRAARWDGFVPASDTWPNRVIAPDEYEAIVADIRAQRDEQVDFDVVVIGNASGTHPTTDSLPAYEHAGVTWVLAQALNVEEAQRRIRRGPPEAVVPEYVAQGLGLQRHEEGPMSFLGKRTTRANGAGSPSSTTTVDRRSPARYRPLCCGAPRGTTR